MKALLLTSPNQLSLRDWPTPQPGPGQVRIRTHAVGICATDLKMIAGWERTGYPSIPGHEWSGWVEAAGEGVNPALVGKPCVAENVLRDGGEVGFEHPGAYAEYFLTEAVNVYPLPVDFPLTIAILTEPLAVALHGLRRVGINDDVWLRKGKATTNDTKHTKGVGTSKAEFGHSGGLCPPLPAFTANSWPEAGFPARALIFGDGPLGLLLLILLKRIGVDQVTLVGGVPERLKLAGELGAVQVYSYQQAGDDLPGGVRRTCNIDFPLVIEASGAQSAAEASIQLCGQGGRLLVIGDYDEARTGFAWNTLLHRELTLVGSNTGAGAWPLAVKLLVEGNLPLARLVTHRFPPEHFAAAFELVRGRKDGIIKAAITW
jgi:threonine dehydrogenase-like Zn-dependent dehydrogenase